MTAGNFNRTDSATSVQARRKIDYNEPTQQFDIQTTTVDFMLGYKYHPVKNTLYWMLTVLTLGLLYKISTWFPKLVITLRLTPCKFSEAEVIFVQSMQGDFEIVPVEELTHDYKREEKSRKWWQRRKPVTQMPLDRRYICWRCSNYLYNPQADAYKKLTFTVEKSLTTDYLQLMQEGLDDEQVHTRTLEYGRNQMTIKVPNYFFLIFEQVTSPYFLFQLYSVGVFCAEDYYQYSIAIIAIALFSVFFTATFVYRHKVSVAKLAKFECPVNVLREGVYQVLSSVELVPGDLIEISDNMTMPCDAVLLQGSCVFNESMLLGESTPVTKNPVGRLKTRDGGGSASNRSNVSVNSSKSSEMEEEFVDYKHANTLFSGTKVLQLKRPMGTKVLALVKNTGFQTTKGGLVLSIQFPHPLDFKFVRHTFYFVGILFLLAMVGFAVTLMYMLRHEELVKDIVLRALDMITIAVPPALPMAMGVGTVFGLYRLAKQDVHCITPQRINMAGKVNTMVFDKTGTLTEDGYDFIGAMATDDSGRFSEFSDDFSHFSSPLQMCIACCHTVSYVGTDIAGDPLELKLFAVTKSQLREHNMYRSFISADPASQFQYEMGVYEQYEFESKLQRMAVVATNTMTQEDFCFIKGSPEKIMELCEQSSIPADYSATLATFTSRGYRVLACAYKIIDGDLLGFVKDSKEQARPEVEQDLRFLGFLVLGNKVKPDSATALYELAGAKIRCIMATGDNPLTAVSVARECGLVEEEYDIFLLEANDPSNLVWHNVDDPSIQLDRNLVPMGKGKVKKFELAVTGKAFEYLYNEYVSEVPGNTFLKVIAGCKVYARMSPTQKLQLVEELIRMGRYVGMCGDGANDCAALKAAHMGVSLSQSEASVAAPFTSILQGVRAIPIVLREGRSSLSTTFDLFRFIALYSIIQFAPSIILYSNYSTLGDYMFLYEDLFLVFPIVITMGLTGTAKKLSLKRPAGSLFSPYVLITLMMHMAVSVAFQVIALTVVSKQDWFIPVYDEDGYSLTYETAVLFLFVNFQYITLGTVLSWGRPFKRYIFTNVYYVFFFVAQLLFSLLLLFLPNENIFLFQEELLIIPRVSGRLLIFFLALANMGATILVEALSINLKTWVKPLCSISRRRNKVYREARHQLRENWDDNSSSSTGKKKTPKYQSAKAGKIDVVVAIE